MFFCVSFFLFSLIVDLLFWFQIDEEDPEILALREVALSSLATKEKKKVKKEKNHNNQAHQREHHHLMNQKNLLDHPLLALPANGLTQMSYGGQRPNFLTQPTPVLQQMYNQDINHQAMHLFMPYRPTFHSQPPIMPTIQPHLNPSFINTPQPHHIHQTRAVTDSSLMHVSLSIEQDEEMALVHEKRAGTYKPTPPSRLSPRSAR